MLVTRIANAALDLVFPRICCGCGERVVEEQRIVCSACLGNQQALQQPICGTCGCPNAVLKLPGRCEDCPKGAIYFRRAMAAYPYAGLSRQLVEKLKYSGRIEYARIMAAAMLHEAGAGLENLPDYLLVPVPLHPTRLRERGFNQAEILGRELIHWTGMTLMPGALRRVRNTSTQTRLSRRERARNIRGAFALGNSDIRDRKCLLIDDVFTTGATLNECARVLKEGGAKEVVGLAYARAVLD